MARSRVPDALTRRHWIQKEMAPPEALAIADAYLEEGRRIDALVFLRKADASDRLRELAATAIEEGDAFLLRAVAQQLGEEPDPEEWERLAGAAERAGLEEYGHTARRQAEVHES